MIYTVENIEYDTDGTLIELPTTLEIEVEDSLNDYDKVEFISDKISDITGFCHLGFTTTPTINE